MYEVFSKHLTRSLVFFFNLAWESRLRLPLIITISFMVLDVRMQLEINVNVANHEEIEDDVEEALEVEVL